MHWEALYTGATESRPASYWAAASAALTLAEGLEQWLEDEAIRAETMKLYAQFIAEEKRRYV